MSLIFSIFAYYFNTKITMNTEESKREIERLQKALEKSQNQVKEAKAKVKAANAKAKRYKAKLEDSKEELKAANRQLKKTTVPKVALTEEQKQFLQELQDLLPDINLLN